MIFIERLTCNKIHRLSTTHFMYLWTNYHFFFPFTNSNPNGADLILSIHIFFVSTWSLFVDFSQSWQDTFSFLLHCRFIFKPIIILPILNAVNNKYLRNMNSLFYIQWKKGREKKIMEKTETTKWKIQQKTTR